MSAACRDVVPLFTHTTSFTPRKVASCFSNASTAGPFANPWLSITFSRAARTSGLSAAVWSFSERNGIMGVV